MKTFDLKHFLLSFAVATILSSCGVDSISLGGNYVLYRDQGTMRFTAIGLDLSGGGTQGLIDGPIQYYGFDDRYVVARLDGDQYYYFAKSTVEDYFEKPKSPSNSKHEKPVKGPLNTSDFAKAKEALGLPVLNHAVRNVR